MNFLRVVFGLAIAGAGFVAALVMLIAFLLLSPASHSPLERVGSILILVLLETAIGFGTYYAFGKVMGPKPPDREGA
jgi:hypothetical protein